jgi:hypothetical protein
MTDKDNEQADNDKRTSRHLEESLSSGRITPAEADVIKLFFATEPPGTGPPPTFSGGCKVRVAE